MVIIYLYPFFCFQRGSKLMTIIGTSGGLLLIDPGITQLGLERALEVTQPILLVMHAGELRPTGAMVIVSLCVLGTGEPYADRPCFLPLCGIRSTEEG